MGIQFLDSDLRTDLFLLSLPSRFGWQLNFSLNQKIPNHIVYGLTTATTLVQMQSHRVGENHHSPGEEKPFIGRLPY